MAGAVESLETEGLGPGNISWLRLNLANTRDMKSAADEFIAEESRLDVLCESFSRCLLQKN